MGAGTAALIGIFRTPTLVAFSRNREKRYHDVGKRGPEC